MNRTAVLLALALGPLCFSGLADDFTLSPPSGNLTLNTNTAGPYLLTVTCANWGRCNTSTTISFSATASPSGPALTFSPASVTTWTSATVNLFINAGATTPGSYTITVTATGGGYQHTATINLTVQAYTGTYQFFRNDPLNPANSTWVGWGTPYTTAYGLTDHCSDPYDPSGCYIPGNGAWLMLPSNPDIPDGTNDYEVRMSLHLPDQSSFAQFWLTARGDAYSSKGYAFVMNNPTYTNGVCTADFQVLKLTPTQSGTDVTVLSDFPHNCAEGMTMRLMVKGSEIKVSLDGGFYASLTDTQFPTGMPGVGIIGPDQDTISRVQIGILDRQAPPAVNSGSVGVSASPLG